VITDRYPEWVRHQLVELGYLKSAHSISSDSVAFNVQPRKTGQLLIGSSRQFGAEHSSVDAPILSRMLRRARSTCPGFPNCHYSNVDRFPRATPDKLPLIGRCLRAAAVAGDRARRPRITTSLGTGRLLADQVLRRPTAIPFEPYLPGRKQEAHA